MMSIELHYTDKSHKTRTPNYEEWFVLEEHARVFLATLCHGLNGALPPARVLPLSCFGENSENRSADGGVEACLASQWKREVSHTVVRGSCKVVVRLLPGMIRDPDVYYYLCAFVFAAKVEPRSVPWCQWKGIDIHEGGRTCDDGMMRPVS
jgi:hypothetical protein